MITIYDHSAAMNVLGCLIKKPDIFLDNSYKIEEDDFVERLHRILYATIFNLYHTGTNKITTIEIDLEIRKYPTQCKVFEDNNGIVFIENILKITNVENFEHYYSLLKKYSCLRELHKKGYSIKEYFDNNILDPKQEELIKKNFQESTVDEIINHIESKMFPIRDKFCLSEDVTECISGNGFRDIFNNLSNEPLIGLSSNDRYFTTVTNGYLPETYFLDTAPTGTGKTRRALGNCVKLGVGIWYDTLKKKWVKNGYNESATFFTTELTVPQISTMAMAYVSGVSEKKIKKNLCTQEEKERVYKAIELIEASNFNIVHLPNFTPSQLEQTVKKFNMQYGTVYFFFDYIFTSISMFQEISTQTRGVNMREDKILLIFSDRIKQLTTTLHCHISASTQASDNWKTSSKPDNSLIASSKSISDKVDIGGVTLPPTKEELEAVSKYLDDKGGFYPKPNLVTHIYKNRFEEYKDIKIFFYFDYGTCRTTEMFVTDRENLLLDIPMTNVVKLDEEEDKQEKTTPVEEKTDKETDKETDLPWEVD